MSGSSWEFHFLGFSFIYEHFNLQTNICPKKGNSEGNGFIARRGCKRVVLTNTNFHKLTFLVTNKGGIFFPGVCVCVVNVCSFVSLHVSGWLSSFVTNYCLKNFNYKPSSENSYKMGILVFKTKNKSPEYYIFLKNGEFCQFYRTESLLCKHNIHWVRIK